MLHEILLSLSGHPSPLLRSCSFETDAITLPERQLLASAAHLSNVHVDLVAHASRLASSHPSAICRAVANAIQSRHLSAFQRKVLDVEESILTLDPELVGAYNIVPLTAVMSDFQQWRRIMEWLLETARFMAAKSNTCQGADLINRLRVDVQSGYRDVAETALSLVAVAETAWLKHVSAWVLYGRLPTLGSADFFVQKSQPPDDDFVCAPQHLPSFVTPATAASMLYIGKSLNRIRAVGDASSSIGGLDHVSSKLQELASLPFPLNSASFSRTIASIRLSLSENTLSKLLPLAKVLEMLQLLRDFLLLGRGEFALALTQEADDKIRNRWRRAGNLSHERDSGLKNLTIKDGEVAAVLNRTWAVLASMQGRHADEDDQLELARDLLRLQLTKSETPPSLSAEQKLVSADVATRLEALPFQNLLFSVPAVLHVELPSPLDMVISPADLQIYSCINSYLLSLRRAHIRLTDLWKMTSLRRHHAAPMGAGEHAVTLRRRWSARSAALRSSWTTASAVIFFLGETEGYLQTEVVAGMWETFSSWLTGHDARQDRRGGGPSGAPAPASVQDGQAHEEQDLFLPDETSDHGRKADAPRNHPTHDPQTLSTAHTLFLGTLARRLLLTQSSFTEPLYALLTHIDYLVLHMRRLHSIFISMDLEADAGVVDAFVDLEQEEEGVLALLHAVEGKARKGIEAVVDTLRALESDPKFLAEWEAEGAMAEDESSGNRRYAPGKIGGIDRLLMKLDFGGWLGSRHDEWYQNG
ncbi:spindle pole body component [Hirsutella rhossiliensis]|uniref:Spindle pole body component n=1 Tax=Hirsutella rhossiliensis TaxID=111463 RepID=A0A9P8MXI9_9HYPO|nr:spc97 / spc98 family domain-containing protein [Hirsutella rhossiliensis]KAH0960987.1 spc97 / spc98 family domain-containing protein [Hirsutella rhossiliensis]